MFRCALRISKERIAPAFTRTAQFLLHAKPLLGVGFVPAPATEIRKERIGDSAGELPLGSRTMPR